MERAFVPCGQLPTKTGDWVCWLLFYDPLQRRKADPHAATNRASDTQVVPDDMRLGWITENEDVESTSCDKFRDFDGNLDVTESWSRMIHVPTHVYDVGEIAEIPMWWYLR